MTAIWQSSICCSFFSVCSAVARAVLAMYAMVKVGSFMMTVLAEMWVLCVKRG